MAYQLFNLPPQQPLSAAGRVLPGSKASFFLTTTDTPTPVYTTSALNVAHTQPVEADAGGRFPAIYLDPTITYKVTVTNSADVLLYTVDPINDQMLSTSIIGGYLTQAIMSPLLNPQTAAEIAADKVPTNYEFVDQDVKRHGWVADNTEGSATSNTAVLNTIFDVGSQTIASARGFSFDLPIGAGYIDESVNLANRVTISGKNKRGTIIRAHSSFSDPYMFTAENGGVSMFDNALKDLTVDCNDVAGLGGVLSDAWQEGGGAFNVLFWKFRTYAARFQTGDGGSASCAFDNCEFFGSTSGATAGIYVDSTVSAVASFGLRTTNCTFSGGGGNQSDLPRGIHMDGGSLLAQLCHFESMETAIYLDGPGHHTLIMCKGSSATAGVTNLVEIASTFTGTLRMIGCFRNGSTNFIKDNRVGGLGTITGYDPPFLQIDSLSLPPIVAVGGNWSGGLFDGSAGSPTLTAGFNVTSITKNGTGDYTITETRARTGTNTGAPWATCNINDAIVRVDLVGASSYRIRIRVGGVATDSNEVKFGNVRLA